MTFLARRVFTLIAVCFALGITFANNNNCPLNPHILSAIASMCVIAFLIAMHRRNLQTTVAALFICCAVLGASRLWEERNLVLSAPIVDIAKESSGQHIVIGRIVGFPRLGGEYVRAVVAVYGIDGVVSDDGLGRIMLFWRSEGDRDLMWGDEVALDASLRLERAPRNLGEFDYRMYLLDRGAAVTAFAFGANGLKRTNKRSNVMQAYSNVRRLLFSRLAERQQSPYSEILISLVYGDKTTELDPVVREEFRRAGMTHILVVSGTQVSLIVFLLIGLLSPGRDDMARRGVINRIAVGSVIVIVVFLYCTLTGFETSVLRAFVMGVMMLIARLSHRETDGFGELARSAIIILAAQPGQLFGASFQLSFVACFGLMYVYSVFGAVVASARFRVVRVALVTLITTAGAQLFVAPVLASHFNQFSYWGLPANLLAIPLASVLLLLGVVHNILAFIAPDIIAVVSAFVLTLGLTLLQFLAHFFGNLNGSDTRVASPAALTIALFYVLAISAGELFRRRRRIREFLTSTFHMYFLTSRHRAGGTVVRLTNEIRLLLVLFAVSSVGMAIAHIMIRPNMPRALMLAAGDSLSLVIQDEQARAYAIIDPSGGELMRRNQIRTVRTVLDHYGVKKPDAVFFTDDPGAKGEIEAEIIWAGVHRKIDFTAKDTATNDSAEISTENLIIGDSTVGLLAKKLSGDGKRYVLFVDALSCKVAVFSGETTQALFTEALNEYGFPDVICVKSGTTFNIEKAIRKAQSTQDSQKRDTRVKDSSDYPEVIWYGRTQDRAIEIALSPNRDKSRVADVIS